MTENSISLEQIAAENQRYMVKVYTWMFAALVITGSVAYVSSKYEPVSKLMYENAWIILGLLIFEFIAVGVLIKLINRMSVPVATLIFVVYSVLNGITFSLIFLIYTEDSIALTFFVTAGTFGVMSVFGYLTKTDLSKWGNLLFMGVIGLCLSGFANWYLKSEILHWITTVVGILIFVGLTAHDTQKIKNANIIGNEGSDDDHRESIIGALILYLDLINLFLYILRIFGRRK
jgi:FtsH-binding integral membrane protein